MFLLLLDRFFFLPGRMDATWEFKKGLFFGDPISYENIEIINNLEIRINKTGNSYSCYLLGCYYGNLYLLETQTLQYTKYCIIEKSSFLD